MADPLSTYAGLSAERASRKATELVEQTAAAGFGWQELAAQQIEAFRATDAEAPIGGEFIVHEVHGGGVFVRRMGRVG